MSRPRYPIPHLSPAPLATTAPPPTPEELAKLPGVAARYGVTIVVPEH